MGGAGDLFGGVGDLFGGVGDLFGNAASYALTPFGIGALGSLGEGTSGTETTWEQSPEQRAMYAALLPAFQQAIGAATGGQPLYNVPQYPYQYMPQMWQVPDISGMMPVSGWWNSMSPQVKAGIMEPYKEGEKQLMETLGAAGSLGSASGGISGNAAAGLGEYWAEAMPKAGLTGWGMMAPGLMAGWQAQLMRNQQGYGDIMNALNMEYQNQIGSYQAPWQAIPTLAGGMAPTFSQGITTQPQNWFQQYGMPLLGLFAQGAGAYGMSKW